LYTFILCSFYINLYNFTYLYNFIKFYHYHILGQKWKVINFFDVNSMYVSTYSNEMPTGRGFDWNLQKDGAFRRKVIAPKSISLACIQWIDYMNNDKLFVDKNGVRQYIQHGWNGDEVEIGNYPVDGYVKVDDKKYFLQFDGCYWVCT